MSDHEERVTEEQLVKLRQGIIAGDLSIFTIAAHIDAMKAERDAAVQRAEEAEEVPKHFGDCWWADADGVPHLFDGTTREPCPICRRVLGKGKGEG